MVAQISVQGQDIFVPAMSLMMAPGTTAMGTLQLPPTIRIARPDEVPQQRDVLDRIIESNFANIVEGYRFYSNKTHELPFTFFAEINVNNDRLWTLFKTLLLQLPDEICLVYNHKDEEPVYSKYVDKYKVLNQLELFRLEIAQDGFLELGALYNDKNFMEEVFVRSAKYLQYWGADEKRFRQTMAAFDLTEVSRLSFIDQYPIVTETLRLYHPDVNSTDDVLERLGTIASTEG